MKILNTEEFILEKQDATAKEKRLRAGKRLVKKLREQGDLTEYVKALNSVLDGSAAGGKEDNTKLYLDALSMIFSGRKPNTNNDAYEKYKFVGEMSISVKDLYPTQSEIDIENSARWATSEKGAEGVNNMFSKRGFGYNFKVPVLVYNDGKKNWIIDGHHRWSQVALLNPTAKLYCMVVRGKADVTEFLKLVQGIIAGVIAKRYDGSTLPVGKAKPNNNIFGEALDGDKIAERIKEMLTDNSGAYKVLKSVLEKHRDTIEKYGGKADFTEEGIGKLVERNRDLMIDNGQTPKTWSADRPVMPQSDKAGATGDDDSSPKSKGSALNILTTQNMFLPNVE